MSRRCVLPDPIKFANEARSVSGQVGLAELSRLEGVLAVPDGVLDWALEGYRGEDGKPYLRLSMQASPVLHCQRCLSSLAWRFDHVSVLQLVRPGTQISDEELEIEEFDTIEGLADFDVLALVEDEMLLALPIAPRHEECVPPEPVGGTEKKSPFDVLAKLRGSGKVQ